MSRLRLDLIVRSYPESSVAKTRSGPGFVETVYIPQRNVDRWTWRLWSGTRIVSTSGSQLYSRRIDCARGAEIGAHVHDLVASGCELAYRDEPDGSDGLGWREVPVEVRILDERVS